MCIIIMKPAGATLDAETVARCAANNPDGFGVAFPTSKGTRVQKTMKAETFLNWAMDERRITVPMLLHCRIATSGVVNTKTCHPFKVANAQPHVKVKQRDTATYYTTHAPVMAHNGILRAFEPSKHSIVSDSIIFCEDWLAPLAELTNLHSDAAEYLIAPVIDGSRLAILTDDGEWSLHGEGWIEDNDIFYSNSGYLPRTNRYGYSYGYGSDWWKDWDEWDYYTPTAKTNETADVIRID